MQAKIREDIIESGLMPMTSAGTLKKYITYNAIRLSDDLEYNMVLIDPNNGDMFLVNSIDFDLI